MKMRSKQDEANTTKQIKTVSNPTMMEEGATVENTKENLVHQLKEKIIIDNFNNMAITSGLPKKQPPGRLGRSIQLISNLYPIDIKSVGNIYHYDVKINNKKRDEGSDLTTLETYKTDQRYRCLNTKLNRKVINKLLQNDVNFQNYHVVFDGKNNLFSPSFLKLDFPYESTVIMQDRIGPNSSQVRVEDTFQVIIEPVEKKNAHGVKTADCVISFEPLLELYRGRDCDFKEIQEAIVALETVLRHSPALKYIPIGRSFFHPSLGDLHPLNGGIEIWFGYHQSLRLAQWTPTVNLNTTATTFFSRISLLNYFAESSGISINRLQYMTSINEDSVEKMSEELKFVKIKATRQSTVRKHCIIEVPKKSAARLEFEYEENGLIKKKKVSDYFLERYNIKLKYPNLPCVRVKPEQKTIYIPLEFCEIIEGQHCNKELTSGQKSEMVKYTSQPSKERFKNIHCIREKVTNYDQDEYLRNFNIRIEHKPLGVSARELAAPNIQYNNKKFQPKDGSWNIRGAKFFSGANISSWWLLSLAGQKCDSKKLSEFTSFLCRIGTEAGLKMEKPIEKEILCDLNKLAQRLHEIKTKKVNLIVVVIPNKDKTLYKKVKQIADAQLGIITQCIDHNNVNNCNASLLSNVCQKINAKMGGINHTLVASEIPQIMGKPILIIGADVSHAGVTDKSGISVAAVVGSLDMIMSRFAVTCKLQKRENLFAVPCSMQKKEYWFKSSEIIFELKIMVINLLKSFYSHTRQKPEKIIFYRDGISDGEFSKVKEREVLDIRSACETLDKEYKPKITYVVVQKRHHVRFTVSNPRDGVGTGRNMAPGTVIDTDVVHPVHRDFYLCSHFGLKGTSRSCHYTILLDDSEFSPDDFQKLTYYLCNTFVRCTKSISHPVPVRYAHLAAYRMRLLLPKTMKEDGAKKQRGSSTEISSELLKAIELPDSIKQKMYFV